MPTRATTTTSDSGGGTSTSTSESSNVTSTTADSGTGDSRKVSGFKAVELNGVGEVTIDQTGTESPKVEADAALLPRLITRVDDGTLVLGVQGNVSSSTTIKFIVTAADLDGLANSGSGSISAKNVETDALDVSISGSGEVTVGGTTGSQSVTMGGSGSYQADKLVSDSATVKMSGSGNAAVNVQDTLNVQIAGSGSLTYLGDPTVKQDVSGQAK